MDSRKNLCVLTWQAFELIISASFFLGNDNIERDDLTLARAYV